MGPRKRAKPNPKTEPVKDAAVSKEGPVTEGVTADTDRPEGERSSKDGEPVKSGPEGGMKTPRASRSWYGGTWSGKSKGAPVTQVARESISAAGSKLFVADSDEGQKSDSPASLKQKPALHKSPSLYLSRAMGSSTRSLPVATTTTTKLNVSGSSTDPQEHGKEGDRRKGGEKGSTAGLAGGEVDKARMAEAQGDKASTGAAETIREDTGKDEVAGAEYVPASASTGWFGWLSRPASTPERGAEKARQGEPPEDSPVTQLGQTPLQQSEVNEQDDTPVEGINPPERPEKSWFGSWRGESKPSSSRNSDEESREPAKGGAVVNSTTTPVSNEARAQIRDLPLGETPAQPTQDPDVDLSTVKPSAWAFWSKEKGQDKSDSGSSQTDVGELAVADTDSQSRPQTAHVDESASPSKSKSVKLGKRARPKAVERVEDAPTTDPIQKDPAKPDPQGKPAPANIDLPDTTAHKSTSKPLPPNHLLPSFHSTYQELQSPSFFQQLSQFFYGKQTPTNHLNLVKDPPRIKKALAIGVHGYFPAPVLRTVLGQPTGTSIRFANSAAEAINKWTTKRGYTCEIEKVALEGEGKVAERIDSLWKLILNWIDHIQRADFILLACHSQGVPVTLILVAKLIEFGCVNAARIGVCAMAGVNLGPFPDYKSRLWSGTAGELFDFANSQSVVSKRYEDALRIAVKHGVRILYVGSIDDQLISLEVALPKHGRVHASDFITHVVGFALKLRNLGISDHGLIRELSSPLAGSLYGGEGHSRLYDDEIVYDLAVHHTLETASLPSSPPLTVRRNYTPPSSSTANPFILPWSMRGVLEEEYVRTQLGGETAELLDQFERWKPSSKVLRDVKWRLEAVRSKL
ncbi:MAG: hypothetical protein M1837_003411 [Sclerophora amabilis]|nr:MAG: hypothetical protein M1837_003411 [Sclerophora amabilis]